MNDNAEDNECLKENGEKLEFSVAIYECLGGGVSIHTWYEYSDINGLQKLLLSKGVKTVILESMNFMDDKSSYKTTCATELSQEDLDWVDAPVTYEDRYLRIFTH